MSEINHISPANLDFSKLKWTRYQGGEEFDYPVDYWTAFLGANPEAGTIDFLTKWEPNSYCPFHRHNGDTTSLVLQGEHHTIDMEDPDRRHTIRTAGSYVQKPAGDLHMEYAGPEGAILFFHIKAVDNRVFETFIGDNEVIDSTLEEFIASFESQ